MNAFKIVFALTMTMLLIFATTSFAQETEERKAAGEEDFIPTTSLFHLDIRALTVFDGSITGLIRDEKPKDEFGIGSSVGGLGSGVGVKMGYLFNGHHDVGGHLQYSNTSVQTKFNPEDKDADEIKMRTYSGNFRIAGYYNYNWHAKGWVMPYVGPVLGIDAQYSQIKDMDDDNSEAKTGMITPFIGVEGGVKLFPMKNVAFDIAMTSTAGPTLYKTRYDDDRNDDDYTGGTINLALNFGLCVYFE